MEENITTLIQTPVSGNYLIKLHTQLIENGQEFGFKTKRFINLHVDWVNIIKLIITGVKLLYKI